MLIVAIIFFFLLMWVSFQFMPIYASRYLYTLLFNIAILILLENIIVYLMTQDDRILFFSISLEENIILKPLKVTLCL